MKQHAIIPIFIPHLGCPNDCVFCNQRKITAHTGAPTTNEVRKTIDTWLATLGEVPTIEVAFYGGSFTGLDMDEQSSYLAVANEYKHTGRIDKIHMSTRPDYIDREILDNLRAYSVDTIELGVQSFDDEVLRKSNRGHSAAIVYAAVELIKEYGFELGIQLMIGLPGDSPESCIYSAEETVKLAPSLARLYPTIVIDDTKLLEMYKRGEYEPLSREEAVTRTAAMYRILDDAGITIMRVGLKSTDVIGEGGAINGGTYHPAFRQLVEGRIARDRIEPELVAISRAAESIPAYSAASNSSTEPLLSDSTATVHANTCVPARTKVDIFSSPTWYSNAVGNKGENKKYFDSKFPELNIKFRIDEQLAPGKFRVRLKK